MWVMDNKGRRGVESKDVYKKRGFRSPDMADALILCFYSGFHITVNDISM
jgi:phage terminase large subunit